MSAPTAETAKGTIHVLSVTPTRLNLGTTQRVTVKLSYTLPQPSPGVISLSFNTDTPNRYRSLASRAADPGSGELEISVDVNPADWPERHDVEMFIALYPQPGDGVRSLTTAKWHFPVERHAGVQ